MPIPAVPDAPDGKIFEWRINRSGTRPGLSTTDLAAAWTCVEAHPAEIENAMHANLVA